MRTKRGWDRARWWLLGLVVVAGPVWAAEPARTANHQAAASREAIAAALAKPVEWAFNETPLDKMAEQVQKVLGVPVLLDRRALEQQAIAADTPITWNLPGMTAEAGLRSILQSHGLVLVVRDEVLLITTPEKEAEQLRTEVYDVTGLLSPEEPTAKEPEPAKAEEKATGDKPAARPPAATRGATALLKAVQALAPSTWEEVGGTGTARFLYVEKNPRLIVSQTGQVHQSITQLLAALRRMQQDTSLQSLAVASESQQQAEKLIQERLDRRVDVAFRETPLSDVVAWFRQKLGLPVSLDLRALEEQAIATDTPVTLQLSGVSARTALERILESHGLAWSFGPELLSITTPEQAAENLMARVYNIAGLSTSLSAAPGIDDPCDAIARTLQATIAPPTWEEVGGTGEIVVYRGPDLTVLVILQTAKVHDQIESLLRRLHEGRRDGE